jgi:hypothetical protein
MKKTFNFGKIKYTNKSKRVNLVEIDVELRTKGGETTFTIDPRTNEKTITGKTPEYVELSICGTIWNAQHTDCVCGGQCLDTIAKYRNQLSDPELFDTLYSLWNNYHLNGMHAGTPEQEKAIEEWKAEGNHYEYTAVCDMLKARGLYEVNYTGLSVGRRYNNEPYKYGHAWLIQPLPGDVLLKVEHMLSV